MSTITKMMRAVSLITEADYDASDSAPPEQSDTDDWAKDLKTNQVIDFLVENPDPVDALIHNFADQNDLDINEVESIFYLLATRTAEFMRGGRSNEKGFTEADADETELKAGIEIESEHSPNSSIAKKIAVDHLSEIPDYYTRLKQMEYAANIND